MSAGQSKYHAACRKFMKAIDAYADATGDRVKVKIRPQRGVRDHVSTDIDVNSPELLRFKPAMRSMTGRPVGGRQ